MARKGISVANVSLCLAILSSMFRCKSSVTIVSFERDNLSCDATLIHAKFSAINKRYKCLVRNRQRDKTNVWLRLAQLPLL
jgi:hypothetical protein